MSVVITSTTDTPDEVLAAHGKPAPEKVEEKPAITEVVEKKEASEAPNEKEAETEAEGEKSEAEVKQKKKGGFKKRIDKLNVKLSAAEQEIQFWRQKAMKETPANEPVKEKQVEIKADGKPVADQFSSHAEYVEALADWKVEQKLSLRDQKSKEVALKADSEKKVSTHMERVSSFKKEHEDFNDLIESIDDIPMSLTVQQVILESENGPELMYELAKHRDEYERICKLPAIAAARELGRFEAKIAKAQASNEETKTTKAPAPISPIGKGKVQSTKSPDEMPYQEYKKYREAQLRR